MNKHSTEKNLLVLLYHEVTNNPSKFLKENNLYVTPNTFENQIRIIKKNLDVIGPENIINNDFNENYSVLITFDDVFKGACMNASTILNKYNLTAVFFLNYGDIEGDVFLSGLVFYLTKYDKRFKVKLQEHISANNEKLSPLFLNVSPDFLKDYLHKYPPTIKDVNDYIGEFATVEDLQSCVERCKNIYYGNHLFRHYNAITLSNQELIDAYELNEQKIKKLPNYVPFFSFPFGQPNTCYTDNSINIIESCGAKYIFSAFPQINRVPLGRVIHRIHLDESHDTENKILRRIFLRGFKPLLRKGFYKLGIKPFWR